MTPPGKAWVCVLGKLLTVSPVKEPHAPHGLCAWWSAGLSTDLESDCLDLSPDLQLQGTWCSASHLPSLRLFPTTGKEIVRTPTSQNWREETSDIIHGKHLAWHLAHSKCSVSVNSLLSSVNIKVHTFKRTSCHKTRSVFSFGILFCLKCVSPPPSFMSYTDPKWPVSRECQIARVFSQNESAHPHCVPCMASRPRGPSHHTGAELVKHGLFLKEL